MFDILGIGNIGNYESRKVARYEKDDVFVDTCAVTDAEQPYETAVAHPQYNDGEIIIVELYDDIESARKGHAKWVKRMTSKKLPVSIEDKSTAQIVKFAKALGCDLNESFKRKT